MKRQRFRQIILTVIIGFLAIYYATVDIYPDGHKDTLTEIDNLITIIFYSILSLFAIIICIKSIQDYLRIENRELSILTPNVLIISILSITFYIYYSANEMNKESNIILKATYTNDINGIDIHLKKDKTYKFDLYSIEGGNYYYGKYKIENDTIYLKMKKWHEDNKHIANKLLIEGDSIYYSFDKNGNYDKSFIMRITKNNL